MIEQKTFYFRRFVRLAAISVSFPTSTSRARHRSMNSITSSLLSKFSVFAIKDWGAAQALCQGILRDTTGLSSALELPDEPFVRS